MKKIIPLVIITLSFLSIQACSQQIGPDQIKTQKGLLTIHPIHHATLALTWNDKAIYVDPTRGAKSFAGLSAPDLILITDIHGDHFSPKTLKAVETPNTVYVVPQAVAQEMPEMFANQLVILNNGETAKKAGIKIHAIPMYNLPQSPDAYHPKGRGNGYVLTIGGKRIYIAGDTEGTPEMRSLENIDVAFIPMNLPYTMSVEQAADAVLDFEPSIVYPYHYSGSNIKKFKKLVNNENHNIKVRLRDWYPNN